MRKKQAIILVVIFLIQLFNLSNPGLNIVDADAYGSPDFSIIRAMDKSSYNQGETATITYTIKPSGLLNTSVKGSVETLIVLDISSDMKGKKLEQAKAAAVSFISSLKAANSKNKVGFISFGYKVNKTIALTENMDMICEYIKSINDNNLLPGTNFHDAFDKSNEMFNDSNASNKYVIFLSNGIPNYFTSDIKINKYENQYKLYEDNNYYYTNYPHNTKRAYENALFEAREMANNNITLYSIGLGGFFELDMGFLTKLSAVTGGKAYNAAISSASDSAFNQIFRNLTNTKISNLVIHDKLPDGISLKNSDSIVVDKQNNISIALQDIIVNTNGAAALPFDYKLEVVLNKAGDYTLSGARIDYSDINSVLSTKQINNMSFNVKSSQGTPELSAIKYINKSELIEGEIAHISYTLTPRGSFYSSGSREPVDIVLAIDKSVGMSKDSKMTNAKQAAEAFVNVFKKANRGDRISLVTFNRYSKIEVPLTTDYDSLISKIRLIQPDYTLSFDSGSNLEIGLRTAGEVIKPGSNQKQIIFISDGIPTYYVDKVNTDKELVEYYLHNNTSGSSGYVILPMRYYDWYYNPSNKNFSGSSMEDYGLDYKEYTYSSNSHKKMQDAIIKQAKNISNGNTSITTVCVGGGIDTDTAFMEEIAEVGRGTANSIDTAEEMTQLLEQMAKSIEYQCLSNIKITELLPDNVEAIQDENIIINGKTVTIDVPDIIFEKDKGTPNPITVSFDAKFNKEGSYQLSEVSKVEFLDWNANSTTSINLNILTIKVIGGQGAITNEKLTAYNGTQQTKTIRKGRFEAVISFDVVTAGKINVILDSPAGSEALINSLGYPIELIDSKGNQYLLTKKTEGILISSVNPLLSGSYTIRTKLSIGNIPEKTYYLQLDSGQDESNQRLKVDVIAMPNIL